MRERKGGECRLRLSSSNVIIVSLHFFYLPTSLSPLPPYLVQWLQNELHEAPLCIRTHCLPCERPSVTKQGGVVIRTFTCTCTCTCTHVYIHVHMAQVKQNTEQSQQTIILFQEQSNHPHLHVQTQVIKKNKQRLLKHVHAHLHVSHVSSTYLALLK